VIAVCETCGSEFVPTRRDATRCSPACRQKAYRRRQHEQQFDELTRRAEAARRLIRVGEVDPILALSYVVAPTRRMEHVA
jgi:hypothetical protein